MKKLLFVFVLILAIGVTQTAQAQLLDKLKKKTEEKIKKEGERRVDDQIDKGVKKGYDEVEKQIEGEEKSAGTKKTLLKQKTTRLTSQIQKELKAILSSQVHQNMILYRAKK